MRKTIPLPRYDDHRTRVRTSWTAQKARADAAAQKAAAQCPDCNGRGWFADDMMGSSFTDCETCKSKSPVAQPFFERMLENG